MTDHTTPAGADTPTDLERAVAGAVRQRLGQAPPAVADSAVAAFRAIPSPTWGPARVLMILAATAGLMLEVPVLLGGATHTGQDVAVLHVAMAIGFALAGWRPARYAGALTPVAAVAAVLLALPITSTGSGRADGLGELAHLPLLLGAAVLLLSKALPGMRHRPAWRRR